MQFDVGAAFRDIAKGNQDALKFLSAFYWWVHAQDDKVDGEGSLMALIEAQLRLLQVVSTNEFYLANRDKIFPVIQTSLLSYMASERLKNAPDIVDRVTAQILKSEYMNVFFAVALMTGGFAHAAEMNRKYRIYDFDAEPVKESLASTPEIS